jgi:hypothetical protein
VTNMFNLDDAAAQKEIRFCLREIGLASGAV